MSSAQERFNYQLEQAKAQLEILESFIEQQSKIRKPNWGDVTHIAYVSEKLSEITESFDTIL